MYGWPGYGTTQKGVSIGVHTNHIYIRPYRLIPSMAMCHRFRCPTLLATYQRVLQGTLEWGREIGIDMEGKVWYTCEIMEIRIGLGTIDDSASRDCDWRGHISAAIGAHTVMAKQLGLGKDKGDWIWCHK